MDPVVGRRDDPAARRQVNLRAMSLPPPPDGIRIRAEPRDSDTCRFVVDRPVFPEGSMFFDSVERADRSALAREILAIPGVSGVLVQDNLVTVSAETGGNWMPIGREVGKRIRGVLAGAEPAVDPSVLDDLPPEEDIRIGVEAVLRDQINPAVASHGGWIDLVGVDRNQVFLRMGGGCQGCGMATATLRQGVERTLRQEVPGIGAILDTTDHAAGTNPYYEAAR